MKQYKSRDKITQKMTRDGLIEVNETQQTAERISKREQDADFQKSPEQQTTQDGTQLQGLPSQTSPLPHAPGAVPARDTATADRVMEHIEAAQTRKSSKKAVRKAQEEATAQTTSSRLQFTEEELAAPELERYIENQTKPLTDWTRQRQLSQSKRNWLRSAPLTKPQARQRPAYALKNRKNRYPAAKRETRCPALHRKQGFSSITRYIPLKRTIPALRGRINQRNLPSAARNTERGS